MKCPECGSTSYEKHCINAGCRWMTCNHGLTIVVFDTKGRSYERAQDRR